MHYLWVTKLQLSAVHESSLAFDVDNVLELQIDDSLLGLLFNYRAQYFGHVKYFGFDSFIERYQNDFAVGVVGEGLHVV